MKAFLLGLVAFAAAPQEDVYESSLVRPPRVSMVEREGREWFDVQAQNASALSVVREIGRVSRRELYGLEQLDRPTLITVDLRQRPLDQVLEYSLGSLGLRFELQKGTIHVLGERTSTLEEQLDLAAASWMRAARRFPDHPNAAEARLAQGELAELRGLYAAARENYLALVEDYPNADVVGEAYMRAGRISASMGQWSEATRLFRTLANSDFASDYAAAARVEWARAMIAQGDSQAALYMLNALDTNYPTVDPIELTARRLVTARALNEVGRYMDALEEIDLADPDFDAYGAWEALHIRAVALEGIGLAADAARAWLLYAREAKGRDKSLAFQHAARLSLLADDELAVLFVAQQARLAGVNEGIDRFERDARERLGLPLADEAAGAADRITRAEEALDRGAFGEARAALQPLFQARGALEAELEVRVVVGWARCRTDELGLDAGLDVLRAARTDFEDARLRGRVDVAAATLYENAGRFDLAIEAYQGRYPQP